MITKKNMERGIHLFDLFHSDFQKFEKEVDTLTSKDQEQIAWWLQKVASHLKPSLETFMS